MIKHIPKKYRKLPKHVQGKKKFKTNTGKHTLDKFEASEPAKTYTKKQTLNTKPRKRGHIFSKGEAKIRETLTELDIRFIREKVFKDCINPETRCKLRYDFYLPKYKLCIEYDGKHHSYKLAEVSKEDFEKQKYRDAIKDKYCMDKGINLLRIPSRKYSQIAKILRETLGIKNSDAN